MSRILFLFAAAIGLCGSVSSEAAPKLKELRGDHFIVRYDGEETYARQVLHQAERLYAAITRNLGHDQLAKPWRGDRRCKIFLYKDQGDFRKAARGMQWAEGMANYKTREIFAYYGNPDFLSSVLPHEMAHVIFRDIMGHTPRIPLWLDEGVALSQEPDRRSELYPVAKKAMADGTLIPFEQMDKIRDAKDMDTKRAGIFYAQSLATVNFLLETLRQDRFLKFCRHLRDGKDVTEALKAVYGTERIQSLSDLQKRVQEYLG